MSTTVTSSKRHIGTMTKFLVSAAIAIVASIAQADTVYVATNGDDSANGSSETPFATIAKAVEAVSATYDPRKVIVRSGTYLFDSEVAATVSVTIESETGNRDDVIIDGQGKTSIFRATDWGNTFTLSGLTIQNGYSADGFSGSSKGGRTAGVYLLGGMVTNCVVRGCMLTGSGTKVARGAGIHAISSLGDGVVARIIDTHVVDNVISNDIPGDGNLSLQGGGICLSNDGGIVRKCTVENNIAWFRKETVATYNPANYLCLGGGIYANQNCQITDCIVRGNSAVSGCSNGYAGGGGGIYAGSGSVVSSCLVYGNTASAEGGGIMASAATVACCTVTNNVIQAVRDGAVMLYGAGVHLGGTGAKCVNSRVEGNSMRGTTTTYSNSAVGGGGGIAITGSNDLVADCSVSDNDSHFGGAFLVYGAMNSVVSNCLVKGNSVTKNGAVVGFWKPENMMMTDCVVVSNTSYNTGVVCYGNDTKAKCLGLTFRNSFFLGNNSTTGDGLFYGNLVATNVQPLTIEYCTIASNTIKSFLVHMGSSAAASNLFCRGNLIFGTRSFNAPYNLIDSVCGPTGAADVLAATTNAWYNFTGGMAGFNYTDATYGNFNTVTADWFIDQAAGDYRLQRLPAVQEKGGPVKDWMGSGRRVGPKDMGDGTMTVEPYDKYGVRIVRNNALPRLKNFPEPGCFELWWPKGVGISFK